MGLQCSQWRGVVGLQCSQWRGVVGLQCSQGVWWAYSVLRGYGGLTVFSGVCGGLTVFSVEGCGGLTGSMSSYCFWE